MSIKYMVIFLAFMTTHCFAQKSHVTLEGIEIICKGGEIDSIDALIFLAARTDNFENLNIESVRASYIMSMNLAKDKINNKKIDVQSHDIFLSIASDNFKYALCEKLKRPKADIATIAKESYFLCRKTLSGGGEVRPLPCF